MRRISAFLIIGLGVFTSCLKVNEYPNEPTISNAKVQLEGDSAYFYLDFIDGDGNVGLGQDDTTGSFADCKTKYNLFCEYQERIGGVWYTMSGDPCVDPNAVPFYYRVPWATPPGQNKTQKGTIKVLMYPAYYLPGPNDTCRFVVTLCDRDLHYSNTIISNEFIKP
jgi:hypothetical protein